MAKKRNIALAHKIEREIKHDVKEIKTEIKKDTQTVILVAAIIILGAFIAFNAVRTNSLMNQITASKLGSSGTISGNTVNPGQFSSIIPKGVPVVYGKELQIAYDDVSATNSAKADSTINKLAKFDTSITLDGEKMQRYITIASSISCEYCCGAKSLIFENGQAACGCAHSYAMRGLAKYLLQNHASEFTDLQILEEMGKWKVLFFPDIHMQKAQILQQKGIELNYVNLASNKYRGIEKGASGGSMVGGC